MMNQSPVETALSRAMIRWSLTKSTLVAETPRSWIFRVEQSGRKLAALKILKPEASEEEGRGARLLRWWSGDGAATVFDIHGDTIFMEWLDGKTLGEPAREGMDGEATAAFCTVVANLHRPRADIPPDLEPIRSRFKALFDTDVRDWPHTSRDLYARCAGIALKLFDKPMPEIPCMATCTTTISSPPIAAGSPSIPRGCWAIRITSSPMPSAIPWARPSSCTTSGASRSLRTPSPFASGCSASASWALPRPMPASRSAGTWPSAAP